MNDAGHIEEKTAAPEIMQEPRGNNAVALFRPPRIPYHPLIETKLGVDQSQWRVLIDSVWPGAKTTDAICLAISYCKARHLDPFKRPVHIVPMWNSALGQEVETVWPGISEVRTTAARTGEYAGSDEAVFGEEVTKTFKGATRKGEKLEVEVTYPSWCRVTVYRVIKGQRVPFPGPRLMWSETFSYKKGVPVPNDRWARAPYQMIEKCAEAAALRKAFPEELAGSLTAEEMEGKLIEHGALPAAWASEPPVDGAAEKAAPANPSSSLMPEKASGQAEGPAREERGPEPSSSAPATAAKAQGAPQDAKPAPEATQGAKAEKNAQRTPRKAAAKASQAKEPPRDEPPQADPSDPGPSADPLDIPAGLDRRADAAPQQAAPEAPADDQPRLMPYNSVSPINPMSWAGAFIALHGRMADAAARAALLEMNAQVIRYVSGTPDAREKLAALAP